jgi:hypothetical protein
MRRSHHHALAGASLSLAVLLAGCDQVKLPGLNPVSPDPAEMAEEASGGYTEADLQPTPEEIGA